MAIIANGWQSNNNDVDDYNNNKKNIIEQKAEASATTPLSSHWHDDTMAKEEIKIQETQWRRWQQQKHQHYCPVIKSTKQATKEQKSPQYIDRCFKELIELRR